MKRITDLDEFALRHVILPYSNIDATIFSSMNGTSNLEIAVHAIKQNPGTAWLGCVKERILDIGFEFPSYVKHDMVDIVNNWQREKDEVAS